MSRIKISFYIVCLIVSCVFYNCSDDSGPYVPEELPNNELAYFPLENGYQADYTFYYSFDYSDYTVKDLRLNGTFRLEVTDTHIKEPETEVFYKLKTTFFIQEEYTDNDFTLTGEYDIMLKDGSLWYVENAPSFERLDEGDPTLMMACPYGCGRNINLKLFNCPGVYNGLPYYGWPRSNYEDCKTDSTCHYNLFAYNGSARPPDTSHAVSIKFRGIKSYVIQQYLGGGNRLTISFFLIE
jgi:hypothetical protein